MLGNKQDERTKIGRSVDWFIAVLILISVVCFSIETLPYISETTRQILNTVELVTIIIFTIEYLYRIYAAEKRIRFIFSFYGLIDLLAIAPYFLAPVMDLRSLRLLRFLRFIRLLKLARYNRAVHRFARAIYLAREEVVITVIGTFVLLFLAAVGIYHFEHEAQPEVFRSIFDCLWWATATFTTVGYGDVYPITVGGRMFTMAILFIGLGLVAASTGIISSALLSARNEEK